MSPKDYSEFELEDFLLDDAFVQWVRTPTPDGDVFWANWRHRHPEREQVLEEACGLVRGLHANRDPLPMSSFRRMQAHLDGVYAALKEPEVRPLGGTDRRPPRWQGWAAAAVVALLLLAGGAWYRAGRPAGETQYATAFGQTRTVTLPDGSRVLLNANSRLRAAARWTDGARREVWLEGEAFFTVAKKKAAPDRGTEGAKFVVHTGQVDVEVLGTRFNVTNRRGQTTVTLNEGKVKLEEGALGGPVIMQPGELVRLGRDGRTLVRKKVNPGQYSSWTENRYVFDDTPLAEIAQRIEDTYGLPVVLKKPGLAQRTFTATIPTKNLDVLLLALSEAFGMEIEKREKEIVFK
jgi:ferric-dicitrate binding protein FerR (iron transport regulator)